MSIRTSFRPAVVYLAVLLAGCSGHQTPSSGSLVPPAESPSSERLQMPLAVSPGAVTLSHFLAKLHRQTQQEAAATRSALNHLVSSGIVAETLSTSSTSSTSSVQTVRTPPKIVPMPILAPMPRIIRQQPKT